MLEHIQLLDQSVILDELPNGALVGSLPHSIDDDTELAEAIASDVKQLFGTEINTNACLEALKTPGGELLTENTAEFDIARIFNPDGTIKAGAVGQMIVIGDTECSKDGAETTQSTFPGVLAVVVILLLIAGSIRHKIHQSNQRFMNEYNAKKQAEAEIQQANLAKAKKHARHLLNLWGIRDAFSRNNRPQPPNVN